MWLIFRACAPDVLPSGAPFLLLFQLLPNQPEQPAKKEEQNQEKNGQKQIFHFYPLTRAGNCFIFRVWRLHPSTPAGTLSEQLRYCPDNQPGNSARNGANNKFFHRFTARRWIFPAAFPFALSQWANLLSCGELFALLDCLYFTITTPLILPAE